MTITSTDLLGADKLEAIKFTLILIIAPLLACIYTLYSIVVNGEKKNPPLAPFGMFETVRALSGSEFPHFMLQCSQKVGSIFRLPLPSRSGIFVVGDKDVARQILTDPLSTKPAEIYEPFNCATGGKTMVTSNGEYWKNARKGVAPAFSSSHIQRMKKVSVEQAKLWIEQRLTPFVESGRSFDVAKEMVGLTMSIICEAAFEYQMDQKEKDDFLFELELVLKEYTFKSSVNPFRAMVGLLLPERRRAAKGARRIQGIARKVVNNYRRLQSPVKGTVIDLIMKCDAFQNDDERMREVLTFLIAGHDTTGYSLSWTLLELARNPDEMDKLRKSIEIISEEDRNKSDALHAVVKESMRLHPVAAGGSIRKTGKDIMKDGEVVIPRGATVFLPLILFLRNPEYFENPGVFKPSRWHNPTEKATSAFFPFSLGKQNCVGQALANAELHTVTALLCSSYSFKVENEGKEEYFLTYKPAGARLKAYKFRPVPAF